MAVKSSTGAGRVRSRHPARAWLRSLARPVSRAGRRFWIAFLLTCALVAFLEYWFESVVDSYEYPGVVQTVFGLTGLYQWLVTGVHFPYPRYTAIVAIDPEKDLKIPNNHQICDQRKIIGDLISRIHTASPSVIAVDKYFGARYQCAETDYLRKAIESASRDTVVVVGRLVDVVSIRGSDRNFFTPSVNFGIQNPRFQDAVVNVDPDTRKIPLRWEVYESKEQAEQPTAAPEWQNTLALQAALAYPGRLLQRNRRISSFVEHNQNPFTSFLKADDFEPILAGQILSADVPGSTGKGSPSEALPEDLRSRFAGRVVLIGEIDPAIDDHLTVVGQMSGLLLQANYIEALLDDRVFRPVRYLDYVFGFAILVGLELILIILHGKEIFLALALGGLFFVSLFVLLLFVKLFGWYVDPAPLSIIPVMTKVLSSLFGRAEEILSHRHRKKPALARQ